MKRMNPELMWCFMKILYKHTEWNQKYYKEYKQPLSYSEGLQNISPTCKNRCTANIQKNENLCIPPLPKEQILHTNNHMEKIHKFTNGCLSFKMLYEDRLQKKGGIPICRHRNNSKPHQSTKINYQIMNTHTHARRSKACRFYHRRK